MSDRRPAIRLQQLYIPNRFRSRERAIFYVPNTVAQALSPTLFAAHNGADGQVIGECQPRHRHQEWLKFLRLIDA